MRLDFDARAWRPDPDRYSLTRNVQSLIDAAADYGLRVDAARVSPGLHRVPVSDKSDADDTGFLIVHEWEALGRKFCRALMGDWRRPDLHEWTPLDTTGLPPTLRAELEDAYARQRAQANADLVAERERAMFAALKRFNEADGDPQTHGYLAHKQVPVYGPMRRDADALLIPFIGREGRPVSYQQIYWSDHRGGWEKRYARGAAIGDDGWYPLDELDGAERIFICEGYATAASLRVVLESELSQLSRDFVCAVVVAFDAGRLKKVAYWMHEAHPEAQVWIVADNDWRAELEGRENVGVNTAVGAAAELAANGVDAYVLLPRFAHSHLDDASATDVNDMVRLVGLDLTVSILNNCAFPFLGNEQAAVTAVITATDAERSVTQCLRQVMQSPALPRRGRTVLTTDMLQQFASLPQEWIVPDFVPAHCVTALYGNGGVGKTRLLQQLALCVASGRPWLGRNVAPRRVLACLLEDPMEELGRRLDMMLAGLELDGAKINGDASWMCAEPNVSPILFRWDEREAQLKAGPLLAQLARTIEDTRPELVILDHLGLLFHGNENVRTQAVGFIQELNSLCQRYDTTVILAAHPSRAGRDTTGESGSTAWDASVRSRLWLQAGRAPGERFLELSKSNYSRLSGLRMPIHEHRGVFVEGETPMIARGPTGELEVDPSLREPMRNLLTVIKTATKLGASESSSNHPIRRLLSDMDVAGYQKEQERDRLRLALRHMIGAGWVQTSDAPPHFLVTPAGAAALE